MTQGLAVLHAGVSDATERRVECVDLARPQGVPEWAWAVHPKDRRNLLQRVLEAGLWSKPRVLHQPPTTWTKLRYVEGHITLVPASARIIVFEGSPSDRKWRGHLGQPEPPIDCLR